jgi:hypothetical protein
MSKKKGAVSKKIEQKLKEYFAKIKENDIKSDSKNFK